MDTKLKKYRYNVIFKIIAWLLCCGSMVVLCFFAANDKMIESSRSPGEIFEYSYAYSNDMESKISIVESALGINFDNELNQKTIDLINIYENSRQHELGLINSMGENSENEATAFESSTIIDQNEAPTGIETTNIIEDNRNETDKFKEQQIIEINNKYDKLIKNAKGSAKDRLVAIKNDNIKYLDENKDIYYAAYDVYGKLVKTNMQGEEANAFFQKYNNHEPTNRVISKQIGEEPYENNEIASMSFSMTDEAFYQAQSEYIYNYEKYKYFISWSVLCAAVFVGAFIWLMMLAGKRTNTDDVIITKLDVIPNDIGILITIITTFIGLLLTEVFLSEILISNLDNGNSVMILDNNISLAVGVLASIVTSVSLFLMWATSTAKRIKRNENYTVIYMAVNGITRAAKESEIKSRYIWGYIGILFLGFVLSACIFLSYIVYKRGVITIILFIISIIYIGCVLRVILQKVAAIKRISRGLDIVAAGDMDYSIQVTEDVELKNIAGKINNITGGFKEAVEKEVKAERMKTELITNISHDIKTPLTSILTYVDLLKKQNLESEDAKKYLDVIDMKTQRLKILTEDLFEAAKATSGNIAVDMTKVELIQFIEQVLAEFADKIKDCPIVFVNDIIDDKMYVLADGKLLFRVLSNVLDNALKYSLEGSRAYLSMEKNEENIVITIKNISKYELNISVEELMERFVRGDVARYTQGSGLGLAIAKDFMKLMGGELKINIDGDLFKVNIVLKEHKD